MLAQTNRRSIVRELLQQFVHFFALLLWAAAALAWFSDRIAPHQGMRSLSVAILCVILINGFFSFWQQFRAERTLEALSGLLPRRTRALRSGDWAELDSWELVPGDVIAIAEGDSVPADCRILESTGLRVNNAAITGESVPESRNPRDRNIVLTGTTAVAGKAVAEVFAIGMSTEFGKIAHLAQRGQETQAPLQLEVRRLSFVLGSLAIGVGALFFWIGRNVGLPLWQNAIFAIGVIVANVPEGLLPTVTLSLAMAAQRMAAKNALVRHLPAVQALGAATVICTDKTGTLTENSMKVRRIESKDFHRLCEIAFFCHELVETRAHGQSHLSGDPMEIALVEMSRPLVPDHRSRKLEEIPFESDRKRLTTVHQTPEGRMLFMKGAPEVVLPRTTLTDRERDNVLATAARIASEGLRVLGFAYRPIAADRSALESETGLSFVGLVGLEDPPRSEVFEAMQKCHRAGIRVIMVTGDHPVTAQAIARKIGLARESGTRFLTGPELGVFSDEELDRRLRDPKTQFARLESAQKLRIVQRLRAMGEIVAVTGDGVNDAPALKEADVGVAMGRTGVDVARESADLVLLDDHFATIVDAIAEGRTIFLNVRKFLTYILTSNVPELVPYLAFSLFRIPLALSVLQILSIDLGTDMVPALALGAERPRGDVMGEPATFFRGHLVDSRLLIRSYGFLGVLEAAGSMAVFFLVLERETYPAATAACLSTVIVMQMVNVFICGSDRRNRLLWFGLGLELVALVVVNYTDFGNRILSTAPTPLWAWPFALLCGLLMLVAEEVRSRLPRSESRMHVLSPKTQGAP